MISPFWIEEFLIRGVENDVLPTVFVNAILRVTICNVEVLILKIQLLEAVNGLSISSSQSRAS
jgi:hypothetical protein